MRVYDWVSIALEKSRNVEKQNPWHDREGKFTERTGAYMFVGHGDEGRLALVEPGGAISDQLFSTEDLNRLKDLKDASGQPTTSAQLASRMLAEREQEGWEERERSYVAAVREANPLPDEEPAPSAPAEERPSSERSYTSEDIPQAEKDEGNAIYAALNSLKEGNEDAFVTPDDYNRLISIIDSWAERFPGVLGRGSYEDIKSEESRNAVMARADRSAALSTAFKQQVSEQLARINAGDFSGITSAEDLKQFDESLDRYEKRYPNLITDEVKAQIEAYEENESLDDLDKIQDLLESFARDGSLDRSDQDSLRSLASSLEDASPDLYALVSDSVEDAVSGASTEETERYTELMGSIEYYVDRYQSEGYLTSDDRDNLEAAVYDFESEFPDDDLRGRLRDLDDALSSRDLSEEDEESASLGSASLYRDISDNRMNQLLDTYRQGSALSSGDLNELYRNLLAADATNKDVSDDVVSTFLTALKHGGQQPAELSSEEKAQQEQLLEAEKARMNAVAQRLSPATFESAVQDMKATGDYQEGADDVIKATLDSMGYAPSIKTLESIMGGAGLTVSVTTYALFGGANPRLFYTAEISDSEGQVATIRRTYSKSNITAELISMAGRAKDTHWAGSMLVREAQMALAFGRKSMTCHANLDRGGYTWAKSGFDFAGEHIAENARDRFTSLVERMFDRLADSVDSEQDRANVSTMKDALTAQAQELNHAWEYTDLRMPLPTHLAATLDQLLEDHNYYEARWASVRHFIQDKDKEDEEKEKYLTHLRGSVKKGAWGIVSMMGTDWDAVINLREGMPSRQRIDKFTKRLDRTLLEGRSK